MLLLVKIRLNHLALLTGVKTIISILFLGHVGEIMISVCVMVQTLL